MYNLDTYHAYPGINMPHASRPGEISLNLDRLAEHVRKRFHAVLVMPISFSNLA